MKKLLKGALTLAIATIVGIPQLQAAVPNWGWSTTTESEADTYDANQSDGLSYVIEIKNANYSKQNVRGLKGLVYTDNSYQTSWPKVECYHPFSLNDATYSNGHSVAQVVRQFGVSMGVVYWINPDKDWIYWWNTVTGESGRTTPTLKYPDNYTEGVEQPNVAFTFDASYTGPGSITNDWHGNLVHMWNGETGWINSSYVKGYATYKAPTKYGELIDFHPKISIMNQTQYPVYRRKLDANNGLVGASNDISNYNYYSPKSVNGPLPNPNYPANEITWGNNTYYHKASSGFRRTDFIGASGNLWSPGIKNGGSYSFSAYNAGWAGGYVFHARNNIAFGQMFADGQYTNWYLNYLLTMYDGTATPNTQTTTDVTPTTASAAYTNYPHEYYFTECDELDYIWNVPYSGTGEFNVRERGRYSWPGYKYNMVCGQPVSTVNNGTDWMNAPKIDSIKGHRVMVHNFWLNYQPQDVVNGSPRRNGQIAFRSCPYSGINYVGELDGAGKLPTDPSRKSPTRNYSLQGWTYAYNKTQNIEPVGLIYTDRATGVNCWSELERVNNNVFAVYTYVPGQGFSKYFITAVEKNNPVTNLNVSRHCYTEGTNSVPGTIDAVITWNAQKYDRETLHRYQIYYQSYKRDASGNLVSDCNQTWQLLDCVDIKTATTGSYTHKNVPYGGMNTADTSDDYDITYLYMVIPIYDDSDHWGTEAIATTTVTSSAPRVPVTGKMIQQTETVNERTLYSFNLELNNLNLTNNFQVPYDDSNKKATTSKFIVVAADDATSVALSQNTGVTMVDATKGTIGNKGIADANYSFVSHNCSHYAGCAHDGATFDLEGKYYVEVNLASAVSSGALPSIVFHNVDPSVTYNVKVFVIAPRNYNFIESDVITAKMEIPELVWSTTPAGFYKLVGDYGSLTENEDMPIGSFRRIDPSTNALDENPSNPVTLNNANYYGTKGSTLKPINVTDEVLGTLNNGVYENAGWRVAYGIYLYDENGDLFALAQLEDQLASAAYAACYSNVKDVICDAIGLKVDYEKQTGEDGRTRKVYTPTNKTYTAKVDVAYRRITDGLEVIKSTYADLVIGSTSLSGLDVTNKAGGSVLGALHQRSGSHFYYDDATTNGYYPYYYDAAMLLDWTADNTLNRYMGYYGASKAVCYGHYETPDKNPDEWVQYHAGSVLSDTEISSFTNQSGMEVLKDGAIGYDGTTNSNWSALAIANDKIPLNIHYVHGSNTPLNSAEAIGAVKFDVTLTAEYPIVNLTNQKAGFRVAENPEEYALRLDASTMEVMTVPTPLTSMQVSSTSITTGVEGIITNAAGGVKLYPNPVGSTFTLQAPMAMGEVRIFTTDGQLVKVVKDINDTMVSINVDELPQGMYIVSTLGVAKMMIKK